MVGIDPCFHDFLDDSFPIRGARASQLESRHCIEDDFVSFLDATELEKAGHAWAHRSYARMLGRQVGWDATGKDGEDGPGWDGKAKDGGFHGIK